MMTQNPPSMLPLSSTDFLPGVSCTFSQRLWKLCRGVWRCSLCRFCVLHGLCSVGSSANLSVTCCDIMQSSFKYLPENDQSWSWSLSQAIPLWENLDASNSVSTQPGFLFLRRILYLPSLIFWTFWWLEFPSGAASLNPNERSLSKTGRFTSARDIPLFLTVYIQKLQVYFSSRYSCFFVHVDVILSLLKSPGEVKIYIGREKSPADLFSKGRKSKDNVLCEGFLELRCCNSMHTVHVIMHNA